MCIGFRGSFSRYCATNAMEGNAGMKITYRRRNLYLENWQGMFDVEILTPNAMWTKGAIILTLACNASSVMLHDRRTRSHLSPSSAELWIFPFQIRPTMNFSESDERRGSTGGDWSISSFHSPPPRRPPTHSHHPGYQLAQQKKRGGKRKRASPRAMDDSLFISPNSPTPHVHQIKTEHPHFPNAHKTICFST